MICTHITFETEKNLQSLVVYSMCKLFSPLRYFFHSSFCFTRKLSESYPEVVFTLFFSIQEQKEVLKRRRAKKVCFPLSQLQSIFVGRASPIIKLLHSSPLRVPLHDSDVQAHADHVSRNQYVLLHQTSFTTCQILYSLHIFARPTTYFLSGSVRQSFH